MNQNLALHVRNNMISDALTAVAHDPRTQTIAFAGLWSLLTVGTLQVNQAIVAAAKQLEVEATPDFKNSCLTIFRELRSHQAAPGISLCDAKSADLHPELAPYIDLLRQSLHASLPETAKACLSPVRASREYDGGMKLVKSKFNKQRFQDAPDAYRAIDSLNQVAYRLNPDVALLRNLPSDPELDYDYRYASRQLDILAATEFHGTFHFRHTLDSRGRIYARAALATPQGDSFAKAFLDFADAKPLGQFGLGALAVHFANCSGHDKLSFVDRIAWAKSQGLKKAAAFADADRDWSEIAPLIEDKKHAFEEYVAGLEFLRATRSDDPRLFESSIITHQDATTSGFQFGAALLGDRATAALTNITGDHTKQDTPADLYGEMAKHLKNLIDGSGDVDVRAYLEVLDRKFCKKPIMTTGYGAGLKTIMKHIGAYLVDIERHDLATANSLALLQPLVEQALELTASSMLSLSTQLRETASSLIDLGVETITWKCPDGFTVYQQYRDASHRKVRLGGKSGIRALTSGEIDPIDDRKMGTALPPNFIHSMDGYMVRLAALQCQQLGVALAPIHDSFGTHAGTFKDLNRELRYAFAHTMAYDWFEAFNKANNTNLHPKKGDYVADEAILGTYMFS